MAAHPIRPPRPTQLCAVLVIALAASCGGGSDGDRAEHIATTDITGDHQLGR